MEETERLDALSDARIVECVLRGDVQAYGVLVERYEHALLGAVLPVVRDIHAARDVVQDVLVQGYVKLGALRDGSRMGFWLMKAARREAIRAARREHRAHRPPMELAGGESSGAEEWLEEDRQRVLRAVAALPAHERLMVTLRFFEGHSVAQIAQITGRPVGTVTKRLSRAVERLRGEWKSED